MLKMQALAPDFTLPGTDGKLHQLSALKNKLVIIYFYPKDNTPGCTQEACDFRDNFSQLTQENCIIFGVSKDSLSSHEKFKNKYALNFILLSDPELKVHAAYHALEDGKTLRTTFLIDKEGKVAKIWPKVSVKNHVEEVLKTVQEFNKS